MLIVDEWMITTNNLILSECPFNEIGLRINLSNYIQFWKALNLHQIAWNMSKLFVEFFASFSMNKQGIDYAKKDVIKFRLGGKQFSMSISQFIMSVILYSAI